MPEKKLPFLRIAEFYEPKDAPKGLRQADQFQKALDQFTGEKRGKKGNVGELMRVVEWDGDSLGVIIFDFQTGQQIGYSGASRVSYNNPPEFTTGISICSSFSNKGLGSLTHQYLRLLLASAFDNGVKLMEINTAELQNRFVVEKMLRREGARRVIKGQDEGWLETIPNPKRIIPLSITTSSVAFQAEQPINFAIFGNGIIRSGNKLLFNQNIVGSINLKTLNLPKSPTPNSTYFEGINLIWQQARQARIRPRLNI